MIEPDAVLQVADGVLDLGVAAVVGLQVQGISVPVGDESVIAVVDEEGQLGTGCGFYPPDDEPHRRGVGLTLEGSVGGLGPAYGPSPGVGQPVVAVQDAGLGWLAGVAQHRAPGGGRQRRCGSGPGGCVVASIGCSLFWGVMSKIRDFGWFRSSRRRPQGLLAETHDGSIFGPEKRALRPV